MFKNHTALLIDCDGTFVLNAEDIHRQCTAATMNSVHKENGVSFDADHFERVWQAQLGRGIANFYVAYTASVPELNAKLSGPAKDRAKEFEADYEGCYKSKIHDLVVRYGFPALISAAKEEGLKVAIVSNARQSILEHTFACAGIEGLDLILGSDEVEKAGYKMKPSGDPYILACKLLDIRPEDAIGFEDSVSGYESLVNAGIDVRVYCQNSLSDAFELRAVDRKLPEPHLILSPEMCVQKYLAMYMEQKESQSAIPKCEPCASPLPFPPPPIYPGPQHQPSL